MSRVFPMQHGVICCASLEFVNSVSHVFTTRLTTRIRAWKSTKPCHDFVNFQSTPANRSFYMWVVTSGTRIALESYALSLHLRKLTGGQTLKLVMVGKPWTAEMRQFILENGMSDVTLELTAVSNEDLRALYSTATMMLFPSLDEGFGWPIVEAQACGCPVATSRRPPMDEVGGDAAIYVDPENPELAAAILRQALPTVAGMRQSSMANAARFRSGMIGSYLSLYEKVCNEKAARKGSELSESITRQTSCSTGGVQ